LCRGLGWSRPRNVFYLCACGGDGRRGSCCYEALSLFHNASHEAHYPTVCSDFRLCNGLNLCVNGMHNGVSAASGLSGNAMRQDDRIRRVIIRLGGEAVRIGQAQGYKLEDIAGQDAEKLARAAEGDRSALDEVESLMLALRNSQQRSEHQRPSMGQDMQKGRRTEIDFINGLIVERGRALGLPTGTHEKLIAAVKRVELGQAPP